MGFFQNKKNDKKDIDCPLTEALMRGGYVQKKERAIEKNK